MLYLVCEFEPPMDVLAPKGRFLLNQLFEL